jgi:hypothetical protein
VPSKVSVGTPWNTGSFCSKNSVDDEVLIVGYWHYEQLNAVNRLNAVLESVKKGSYKPSDVVQCTKLAYEKLLR